jgi:hypothetical protein
LTHTLVHHKSRERKNKTALSVKLDALHHHPRMNWTTGWPRQLSGPSVWVVRVMRQLVHGERIAFLAFPRGGAHRREGDRARLARWGQVKG